MPAVSNSQARLARMALAHKHGHRLKGISKAGMEKVRQMADMSEDSLKDYMHMRKSKGSVLTGRG